MPGGSGSSTGCKGPCKFDLGVFEALQMSSQMKPVSSLLKALRRRSSSLRSKLEADLRKACIGNPWRAGVYLSQVTVTREGAALAQVQLHCQLQAECGWWSYKLASALDTFVRDAHDGAFRRPLEVCRKGMASRSLQSNSKVTLPGCPSLEALHTNELQTRKKVP